MNSGSRAVDAAIVRSLRRQYAVIVGTKNFTSQSGDHYEVRGQGSGGKVQKSIGLFQALVLIPTPDPLFWPLIWHSPIEKQGHRA